MQSSRLIFLITLLILWVFNIAYSQEHEGYWFKRADTPTPRQEMPVIEYQGKIYLMGGITVSQEPTDIVEIYDPSTDTWETGTPFPEPLHHFALAVVNDKFYVFGGYNNISTGMMPGNTVYEYDPGQDVWTEKASMLFARGEMAAIAFQGKIYVMGGGESPAEGSDLNEVYDPASDSWSSLTPLPTGRNHLALVVIDSLIYAIGGREAVFNYAALEAYSPASDTWYVLPDMPTPRGGLSASTLGDKFYAMGGEILYPAYGIHYRVEEFDTQTRTWRRVTSMLTARHGIGAATVGDTVYVISGAPNPLYGVTPANEGFVMGTCVDSDHDGYGDPEMPDNTCPEDNCPYGYNPSQEDSDGDMIPDACDICPYDIDNDIDNDNVCGDIDNCPEIPNEDQADDDDDGIGNVCDYTCGDANDDESINVGDVVFLINLIFHDGPPPNLEEAGDVNCDESLNIGDAVFLGNFVFQVDAPEPCSACP